MECYLKQTDKCLVLPDKLGLGIWHFGRLWINGGYAHRMNGKSRIHLDIKEDLEEKREDTNEYGDIYDGFYDPVLPLRSKQGF